MLRFWVSLSTPPGCWSMVNVISYVWVLVLFHFFHNTKVWIFCVFGFKCLFTVFFRMVIWWKLWKYFIFHAMTCGHEYVLARDVIYTSRAYATMSVSVCLDGSALGRGVCREHSGCANQRSWRHHTIPNNHGRRRCCGCWGEGSSRSMLATARPSCYWWVWDALPASLG